MLMFSLTVGIAKISVLKKKREASDGLTGMFFSAVKTWQYNTLLEWKVSIKVINDWKRRHKSRKLLIDDMS